MFWDLNWSHVFALPNSGADSEGFFRYAVAVANDPSLAFEGQGRMFSKLFGLLFSVTGAYRIVGQYTNVLLGLSIVLLFDSITRRFRLSEGRRLQVLAVTALLPNTLIMSAIFLRESIIAFLIAVSAFFFVRWFRGGSLLNFMLVLAAVLAASTLHAGVIAVGAGYIAVAVLYRRDTRNFGLSWHSFVYLALFLVVVQLVLTEYPDVFLGKFEQFDNEGALLAKTNSRLGGSQYLSGLTVDSYTDMVLVGPLRAFYFLLSPMPWDARGAVDILTFMTDSLFYLLAPLIFLSVRKRLNHEERVLGFAILIVIFVSSLVFGAGVSNAGTAVRHRFKFISLFMVLFALAQVGVQRKISGNGVMHRRRQSSLNVGAPHRANDEQPQGEQMSRPSGTVLRTNRVDRRAASVGPETNRSAEAGAIKW